SHVENGQRGLHIALAGSADVEKGADGLLSEVLLLAVPQADDLALGDVGGKSQGQLVEPLPWMGGHEVIVRGMQTLLAQSGGEIRYSGFAQLLAHQAVVVHV